MFPLDAAAFGRVLRAGGATGALADENAEPMIETLNHYEINTLNRVGHFLAQVLVESGRLRYREEIASGSAYEGRKDLGNVETGDGRRFKGRGFIQLTGRANYKAYGETLQTGGRTDWDVVTSPTLVGTTFCSDSAGYFWNREKLNLEADKGDDIVNVQRISRAVNRGNPNSKKPANGEGDRIDAFRKVMAQLRKEGMK
jgi:putative chitinase